MRCFHLALGLHAGEQSPHVSCKSSLEADRDEVSSNQGEVGVDIDTEWIRFEPYIGKAPGDCVCAASACVAIVTNDVLLPQADTFERPEEIRGDMLMNKVKPLLRFPHTHRLIWVYLLQKNDELHPCEIKTRQVVKHELCLSAE